MTVCVWSTTELDTRGAARLTTEASSGPPLPLSEGERSFVTKS
jgi:hypothetical protein